MAEKPQSSTKEHFNSEKNFEPNEYEDYGYYFFPERFGKIYTAPWYSLFTYRGSREVLKKSQCENNVKDAIENHAGVKLLLSALKTVGCETNLLRHFSCEHCDKAVKGGFDPSTNQIIICHNNTYEYEDCSKILLHELVHAFDHCRANLNFSDSKHVACTEIRAANLTSCALKDKLLYNFSIKLKNTRKDCIRREAALSLQMVRNISEKEAYFIIDSVFDKCMADMEPFGRPIRSYEDFKWVYANRFKYGYK